MSPPAARRPPAVRANTSTPRCKNRGALVTELQFVTSLIESDPKVLSVRLFISAIKWTSVKLLCSAQFCIFLSLFLL